MEKPKKINHIYLTQKVSCCNHKFACGWCFAVLERRDEYCWSCGCETTDTGESYLDGLIESLSDKPTDKPIGVSIGVLELPTRVYHALRNRADIHTIEQLDNTDIEELSMTIPNIGKQYVLVIKEALDNYHAEKKDQP